MLYKHKRGLDSMSEHAFNKSILKGIKKLGGDACSHEDAYTAGIPDLSGCIQKMSFWIEAKTADWPKRAATKIRLKHPISYQQRNWLVRRGRRGCPCFVFVRAGRDCFVIWWGHLDDFMENGWTKEDCEQKAILFWHNRVDWTRFVKLLREV